MKRREAGGAAWAKRIAGLLTEAGLTPRVVVTRDGAPDPLIERLFWRATAAKRSAWCRTWIAARRSMVSAR
ncbi:MAG: hypothetical protein QM811_02690 [Pirellulales bacterium]